MVCINSKTHTAILTYYNYTPRQDAGLFNFSDFLHTQLKFLVKHRKFATISHDTNSSKNATLGNVISKACHF